MNLSASSQKANLPLLALGKGTIKFECSRIESSALISLIAQFLVRNYDGKMKQERTNTIHINRAKSDGQK